MAYGAEQAKLSRLVAVFEENFCDAETKGVSYGIPTAWIRGAFAALPGADCGLTDSHCLPELLLGSVSSWA